MPTDREVGLAFVVPGVPGKNKQIICSQETLVFWITTSCGTTIISQYVVAICKFGSEETSYEYFYQKL